MYEKRHAIGQFPSTVKKLGETRPVGGPVPGGRPPRTERGSYPELAELAAWFHQALGECGHSSINAFVQQHTLDKNKVYEVFNGTVLLSLKSTRALAQLLRRDPAEVEPIWLRAREAMDLRLMAEEDGGRPAVTTWAEIPRPELALRNVLDALTSAVEQLPYRLLGIAPPPLSAVYVRQHLRRGSAEADTTSDKIRDREEARHDRGEPAGAEVPVTVAEALNRSEHLLITGEAGAGKSTLGHQLIRQLSQIWLRRESAANPPLSEPVVPLRVSARSLIGEGSWSTVLAEATRRALGPYLVTEPSQHLFAGRIHGARWLIVVDGLDEILDRPTRASIIRAIGQHTRPGGDYRFVITSRPLPDEELAPLRGGHIGICRIEPFKEEELKLFADRWFTAQDPITAQNRAAQFIRQVEDSRLKDLVRNPLLATIAALADTREPTRALPTNRVDLYQRFYEYLVTDEEASGRATLAELRRLREEQPSRYRLFEWIHSRRTEIIDAMAEERLTTETPLPEVAYTWVRHNVPQEIELSPGWEKDFDRLLIDTGLFVYESSGVRFLHHTFAEFIAARTYAAKIPASFPNMEEWISRGVQETQRNFALLAMVLWGRVQGNDVALVLTRLIDGDTQRAMLAGRLLAESDAPEDLASRAVVDRLINLALGNCREGRESIFSQHAYLRRPITRFSVAEDVIEVLGLLTGNRYAEARLRHILGRTELPFETRALALDALSRIIPDTEALLLLRDLSKYTSDSRDVAIFASGCIELEKRVSEETRATLLHIASDPLTDAEARAVVAEKLSEVGEGSAATRAAFRVLADSDADNVDLRSAVKVILKNSAGAPDARALISALPNRDFDKMAEVAKELLNAGHTEDATNISWDILKNPATMSDALGRAAEVWLSCSSSGSVTELLGMLRSRASWKPSEQAAISKRLFDAGYTQEAKELAHVVLSNRESNGYVIGIAADLLSKGNADSAELLQALQERGTLDAWARAAVSEVLAEAGSAAEAVDMARLVFTDEQADEYDIRRAAKAAVLADESVRTEFVAMAAAREAGTHTEVVLKVAALMALQEKELAEGLVLSLAVDPYIDPQRLRSILREATSTGGGQLAERLTKALDNENATEINRFIAADSLAAAGHLSAAAKVWCDLLLSAAFPPSDSALVLTRLLNTGNRESAISKLCEALSATDIKPAVRTRLRSLLAWARLSAPESNCLSESACFFQP
ncbi:NACHT domain-containing protein [Streptomyces sp. NPDC055952]|uniref:NACHT domain-containing protein n=1 Tax=Streptomyces sp. NPDC055952 TaxID=3345663 RepID=UPI0035DA813E